MSEKRNRPAGDSCILAEILGDTLRPGGLELTSRIMAAADIKPNQSILDIGCGKGATAVFLAQRYSCRVTGVDPAEEMVFSSQARSLENGLTGQVNFLAADGEHLPFEEASFDAVISECAFSLLPNRKQAADEVRRVLKPQGKFILTDIILRGSADFSQQSRIAFPCCLSSACSIEEYLRLFKQSGFVPFHVEDHSDQLAEITFRLGLALGDLDQWAAESLKGPCHKKGRAAAPVSPELFLDFLQQGKPGYAVIMMRKM